MRLAGIDTSVFQAHSCRMVSATKAMESGISIEEILGKADWSNSSTFKKFYFRPNPTDDTYASKVLRVRTCMSALNMHYYISRKS